MTEIREKRYESKSRDAAVPIAPSSIPTARRHHFKPNLLTAASKPRRPMSPCSITKLLQFERRKDCEEK
ncbi:hypothetical protein M0R45_008824 [Rubus argutus]|uniref:Uncharacterized protein n=1 Tax=Rubus argutus TaxID=59490 RepID=A0AAW1X6Z8_RUBAR